MLESLFLNTVSIHDLLLMMRNCSEYHYSFGTSTPVPDTAFASYRRFTNSDQRRFQNGKCQSPRIRPRITILTATFQIIIGGDSAGGHLTLSLLSHLNHPRTPDRLPSAVANSESTPEIKVPGGQKRLAAAFLVSPLCSVDITQPSYEIRCNVDMLSKTAVHQTGEFLLSGSSAQAEQNLGQGWSMALDMRDEHVLGWWKGLDAVVSNVLITAGQEEALRDHCVQFADVLRNVERKGSGFNVKLLLQQDETHDAALFDFNAGRALSTSTKVIDRFVVDVFSRLK